MLDHPRFPHSSSSLVLRIGHRWNKTRTSFRDGTRSSRCGSRGASRSDLILPFYLANRSRGFGVYSPVMHAPPDKFRSWHRGIGLSKQEHEDRQRQRDAQRRQDVTLLMEARNRLLSEMDRLGVERPVAHQGPVPCRLNGVPWKERSACSGRNNEDAQLTSDERSMLSAGSLVDCVKS